MEHALLEAGEWVFEITDERIIASVRAGIRLVGSPSWRIGRHGEVEAAAQATQWISLAGAASDPGLIHAIETNTPPICSGQDGRWPLRWSPPFTSRADPIPRRPAVEGPENPLTRL